jgi:DNA-binding IclR family transcriptional regulator
MAAPQTLIGRRRLAILKAVAAAKGGITVLELTQRLGLSGRTILTYLRFLFCLKLVSRLHYRRWLIAPGVHPSRSFDGTRLDPKEGRNVANR